MEKCSIFGIGVFLVTFMLMSCREDGIEMNIDPELQPYLDSFVGEAADRGLDIELAEAALTMEIQPIDKPRTAGQCTQVRGSSNHIIIDPVYWKAYTHLKREALVFHELGHCILDRSHLDDRDEFGSCVSLMESGGADCRMEYTEQNREKYLDELFRQ